MDGAAGNVSARDALALEENVFFLVGPAQAALGKRIAARASPFSIERIEPLFAATVQHGK